jgi:hypothetical protein
VLEVEHLAELGRLGLLILGLAIGAQQAGAEGLAAARAAQHDLLLFLVVRVEQQAVGALLLQKELVEVLVKRGDQHGTEDAGAAQNHTKPESELDIHIVGQSRRHQIVNDRAQAGDGKVDAERESQLFALEPLGQNGAVRHTQTLTANAVHHTT